MASNKELEKQQDPSATSAAYEAMAPKWAMIEHLLGGTAAMRAAGQTYLPKHTAEEDDAYETRLNQTTLYNVTELTLKSLVGRVFREPMKLGDDVPQQIKDIAPDIDSCQTDISAFCQLWFGEAMAKGFAHVLVDMPSIDPAARGTRTLADDAAENRRPFWSLIKPENLIFAYEEPINGVSTLTHVRIVEFESYMEGFCEYTRMKIRVLSPGLWELWQNENDDKPGRKPKWAMESSGTSDLSVIPLVTFYAGKKECTLLAKPPLEDLAHLNITHWQSSSDQRNILTVARFPMLAGSGTVQEAGKESIKIGPRQLLSMRDPNGRFYYVEHTGKAIGAGNDDLNKLEDQMAAYGAEFLRRQIAGRTAFERAADQGEAMSPLKDMATRFAVSVKAALDLTAEWLALADDSGGSALVNTDYTEEEVTQAPLATLASGRERGDISRKLWRSEMMRYGILNPDLNVAEEDAELAREAKEGPFPPSYYRGSVSLKGIPQPGDNTELPAESAQAAAAAAAPKPAAAASDSIGPKVVVRPAKSKPAAKS